jgi:hypothetical protein
MHRGAIVEIVAGANGSDVISQQQLKIFQEDVKCIELQEIYVHGRLYQALFSS